MAKHPAAFINVIADEGTKAEAVEQLQETWDKLKDTEIKLGAVESAARGVLSEAWKLPPTVTEQMPSLNRLSALLHEGEALSDE